MNPAGKRRARLESHFRRALEAVDAGAAVRAAVSRRNGELWIGDAGLRPGVRLRVLAVGKAAAAMAQALECEAGDWIESGLAITKEGHGVALEHIALRETAHPVPDPRSEAAAREALTLVEETGPEEVLVVLLSGGASSLLSCPAPGLTLADVARTTAVLLDAGADIETLNAVRKHLSAVSGGRLARRSRARCIEVLAISDVRDDRLDVLGSGPFAPDPSSYADALHALDDADPQRRLPAPVWAHLAAGVRGEIEETPKPRDPVFARVRTRVLANNGTALRAAAAAAAAEGWVPIVLEEALTGEARTVGRRLGALALAAASDRPVCLIAGGESTVHVRGPGKGGRSQEIALAASLQLRGRGGSGILAAGTDGTDGPTDAAGAYADGETVERGRERGVDALAALAANDSYVFFAAEGGLFRTGPTLTNVRDVALLEIDPR